VGYGWEIMTGPESLPWTESAEANRLLAENPLALLIGMLLDQQFPMERAFAGPYLLSRRLEKQPSAALLAAEDPARLEEAFRGPPALHRYPASMAKRTQELATHLVEHYGGDPARLWATAPDGAELYRRLRELPGFGEAKARIFVGVLGKRLGIQPPGWEEQAADWPSIADVASFDDIEALREKKRAAKR
jgi:uncharacterized HhH-GPD family protein